MDLGIPGNPQTKGPAWATTSHQNHHLYSSWEKGSRWPGRDSSAALQVAPLGVVTYSELRLLEPLVAKEVEGGQGRPEHP